MFSKLLLDELSLLTISGHPKSHTLLQSTKLTSVSVNPVHHTVLLSGTLVVRHAALRPSEETLE